MPERGIVTPRPSIAIRSADGLAEAERRHRAVVDSDEERNPAYDAVGIGRRERVADGPGVSGKPGQRADARPRRRQRQRDLRERWPGCVARGAGVRRCPGRVERDRVDDVVRQRGRLAQQRVAPGAATTGQARLPEGHVDTDDRGASAGEAGDEPGEQRPVPRTRAKSSLARRVARDDHQRGADGRRLARAHTMIVDRPLERGEAGAGEDGDGRRRQAGREADDRGREHAAENPESS